MPNKKSRKQVSKQKDTLKLIEHIMSGDKKKADKIIKKIVEHNIANKMRKIAGNEDLI